MFKRPHHQLIAQVLLTLNGPLLREHCCLFGGGTAMALRYGEYRESVDVDFLVSDLDCYRRMRQLVTETPGLKALFREDTGTVIQFAPVRADQYGIRSMLLIADQQVKFEIVFEGRIELQFPGTDDKICGISTLTPLDMAAGKLLANSDRWADDGVFNRDLIDLAMMRPSRNLLRAAVTKAEKAYGKAIINDISKALDKFQTRRDWLERCMQAMEISTPKALLWERIRAFKQRLPTPKA